MSGHPRLFLAVRVPESVFAEAVGEAGPHLALRSALPVYPADAHVTVCFLGPTAEERVPEVVRAAGAAARAVRPGTVSLLGLGAFPTGRRAPVLCAGVEDDGTLAALTRRLSEDLAGSFPEPSDRAFVPHLTLARYDPPTRLPGLAAVDLGAPFPADRLVLFRTRPGATGTGEGRYEALDTFPLGG